MTPTPSPHTATLQHFRNWATSRASRRDASRDIQWTAVNTPVTPLADDGRADEQEDTSDVDITEEQPLEDGEIEIEDGGEEDIEGMDGEVGVEEEGGIEEVPMEIDPPFDATSMGLKEIGNLASWTVSSCKPGCGVEALRDEDVNMFWQSDGPQPHHLNIHFSRLVSIRAIRLYLDFEADESYTPTRITLLAGTGYHDLIPFSALEFAQPKGWIDVPLDHVGGGEDGKTLRAFLVQIKVVENHQNGKDTHVRGLKIYAKDEKGMKGARSGVVREVDKERDREREMRTTPGKFKIRGRGARMGKAWQELDWMDEPELR